jgi:hypothetical protein
MASAAMADRHGSADARDRGNRKVGVYVANGVARQLDGTTRAPV